ncbi:MAG: 4-hydroxy-tetrahydrodipicolinate reductase [Clostridia bacterium]|nr:4-hydroxy-tetrahydrodipicolinate reductase [Clostridia bacterium]
MIKVAINGINGKMGKVLSNAVRNQDDMELVCGFDIYDDGTNGCPVYQAPSDCSHKVDVVIDFSHPALFEGLLEYGLATKTPLVIATTGLSHEQKERMVEVSKEIAVFHSANMSLGVNLLIDLVKQAAQVLYGNFDIEIIEKHHNQKIDAPSGTALMIADEIADALDDSMQYVYDRHSVRKKRETVEIGIHAVRGGTIVGEHEVLFAGKDEMISVTHTATSKEIFATGGIRAARFLAGKQNGYYSMKDVISNQ